MTTWMQRSNMFLSTQKLICLYQAQKATPWPRRCFWIRTRRIRELLLIINTKKIAFPTDGWGTALAKVHYLPVRKWTDILRIQEKSTKTANITRCLQDFEKPRFFWLMNTFTRSRLTKINVRVKKLIACNV